MMMWQPWGWNMMGGGTWMMLFNFIFGLLVLAGIVILIVWLVKGFSGPQTGSGGGQDEALKVLKERLAKGEIDEETYERLYRKLKE